MSNKLDEKTFGDTPAAMYLVRELNKLGTSVAKSVGRRISSTTGAVNNLLYAYSLGALPPKTIANCLRLMRDEVVSDEGFFQEGYGETSLIDQLRRNVQIGYIKRGLRLCQVARKAEHVMASPKTRGVVYQTDYSDEVFIFGGEPKQPLQVGVVNSTGKHVRIFSLDVSDVTSKLLMERSNKRCARQGKPHMKDKS